MENPIIGGVNDSTKTMKQKWKLWKSNYETKVGQEHISLNWGFRSLLNT